MYQFNYQKAGSQDDAVSALSSAEDGKFLAGGMTLIPTLKQRLAQPSDLVDLSGINDMVGIQDGGDSITIGAMTRHVDVANSDVVGSKIPALQHLASHIGDPQVRNRGRSSHVTGSVVTTNGSNSSWCDGQGANTNVRCGGGDKCAGSVVLDVGAQRSHSRSYGHELSGNGRRVSTSIARCCCYRNSL